MIQVQTPKFSSENILKPELTNISLLKLEEIIYREISIGIK